MLLTPFPFSCYGIVRVQIAVEMEISDCFFIRYRILVVGEKPLFKPENYGIVKT